MRPTFSLLNLIVMATLHVVAVVTVAMSVIDAPPWQDLALGGTWYWLSGLSITGGYHRLFAHRSYRCSRLVTAFYLLFGGAAAQNSALNWTSDHRRHHAHSDAEGDPYDARRGLWWSHMGWVLQEDLPRDFSNARDLVADPLVRWQHRHYWAIAIVVGGGIPALIAISWGDPVGGLLWAGCVRLVAQYHSTFAINSIAHRFGDRPYCTSTSARDNVLVALLTMGEGYHNFHHRFPSDYRNGVRWRDYDPTKWLVSLLAAVGLASHLKRTSPESIAHARAQLTEPF
ncbi:MAG TPA: fatty acid desaturase [Vicinamibacterales bacterium]|nr:fatty acid desaturase [Vicinamibacterales bacterium]